MIDDKKFQSRAIHVYFSLVLVFFNTKAIKLEK